MNMFRPYLMGVEFTSWGDHQPLVHIYNDHSRLAPVRVSKHRSKITDLKFEDKYLPGNKNACDYFSRHPMPIEGFTRRQKKENMVDEEEDITIMKIMFSDLPPAINKRILQETAARDPTYQKLKKAEDQRTQSSPGTGWSGRNCV